MSQVESLVGRPSGLRLATGFYAIEAFGLRDTTRIAAAVNLAVAAVTLAIDWRAGLAARMPAIAAVAASSLAKSAVSRRAVHAALVAITVSGFASLAYEVLWTRALTRYLYNSTYAFTAMLATFLAGIALGSALYSRWLARSARPLAWLAALELGIGLGFLASYRIFPEVGRVAVSGVASFAASIEAMFVRAALILLLPALFLGATLPLVTAICTGSEGGVGRGLARVYAWNTFGAIAGSLAIAFVLIPAFGMHGSLVLLVVANLVLAVGVAWLEPAFAARRGALAVGSVVLLLFVVGATRDDVFRRTFVPATGELVFYREGATDTAGVFQGGDASKPYRVLVYEDQRGTAGTYTASWNFFDGHLGLLLHPGTPRRALVICLGAGNTLSAIASHPELERVDAVELSENTVAAARWFWTNDGVLDDPKVHHIVDDGRNFLRNTDQVYDLIALEPPEVFTAGVINLYTRDFYADAAKRLAPDGVLVQWLLVGQATLDEERMLLRAMRDVFPWATAWKQPREAALALVASKTPLSISYDQLRRRIGEGRVAQDLSLTPIRDADELLAFLVLDPEGFEAFVRDAAPVTDDRTVLDFSMPRSAGSGFGFGLMQWHRAAVASEAVKALEARIAGYFALRRAVTPYLADLGGEPPEAVEARIKVARERRLGRQVAPTEDEWRALRQDPSRMWRNEQR